MAAATEAKKIPFPYDKKQMRQYANEWEFDTWGTCVCPESGGTSGACAMCSGTGDLLLWCCGENAEFGHATKCTFDEKVHDEMDYHQLIRAKLLDRPKWYDDTVTVSPEKKCAIPSALETLPQNIKAGKIKRLSFDQVIEFPDDTIHRIGDRVCVDYHRYCHEVTIVRRENDDGDWVVVDDAGVESICHEDSFERLRGIGDLVFAVKEELAYDATESDNDENGVTFDVGDLVFVPTTNKSRFVQVKLLKCLSAVSNRRWSAVDGSGGLHEVNYSDCMLWKSDKRLAPPSSDDDEEDDKPAAATTKPIRKHNGNDDDAPSSKKQKTETVAVAAAVTPN